MLEKANTYDKIGLVKREVDVAVEHLKVFRQKYTFKENLRSIEWLDPDRLYKLNPDEVGEFFRFIESYLKPLGVSSASSNVYRNARLQIGDFRNLLRTAVDDRKSLAQKVDARWERIGGLGQDKQLAKKIIFCFNYESGKVLPIFSNQHLRHFVNRTVEEPNMQTKFLSLGQEYEQYTSELLKTKNGTPLTRSWSVIYFTRFLYDNYPPPDTERPAEDRKNTAVTEEQLDMQGFVTLLGQLQRKSKITGEQFREYREIWVRQPSEREGLTSRLKTLNTQS